MTDDKTQSPSRRSGSPAIDRPVLGSADQGFGRLAAWVCRMPWLLGLVRVLKKSRTKAAFILVAWCLAEGVYLRERPLNLAGPGQLGVIGILLIAAGTAFRFSALGCIRKKEHLATDGVYSLCRHPLYLGSILLAYGFCTLLADLENFILATVYFVVFYPLTIVWEEIRLATFYGEAHRRYRERTPALLPFGAFRTGAFAWRQAILHGGALLLAVVGGLLVGVQVMAKAL